jgi:hypothetical protein
MTHSSSDSCNVWFLQLVHNWLVLLKLVYLRNTLTYQCNFFVAMSFFLSKYCQDTVVTTVNYTIKENLSQMAVWHIKCLNFCLFLKHHILFSVEIWEKIHLRHSYWKHWQINSLSVRKFGSFLQFQSRCSVFIPIEYSAWKLDVRAREVLILLTTVPAFAWTLIRFGSYITWLSTDQSWVVLNSIFTLLAVKSILVLVNGF